MREKTVELTRRENQRASALGSARCTGKTNKQIAEALELSVRQVQRLKKALREEGPIGLAHGNRGSEAAHAIPEAVAVRVVELYETKYAGFNFSHFHEKLLESEAIEISRPTVGRVLRKAGYRSPRKRRANKHRSRRERRACEGAMLQLDGSPHDWLESRGPKMCLVGAIDDATGKVVGVLFRQYEDAQGYFLMMRHVVNHYGIPETVYHDHHGIFERDSKKDEALWEQLEGKRAPTQFGRLMEELGIRQIPANSPQAKGRIERLWGTFADRLTSELRLANARTIEEANEVLRTVVIKHNQKFHRQPHDPQSAYRKPDKRMDLDELFCFKYKRSVAMDNTVSFFGTTIQIQPGPARRSYARCLVDIHERFDGSFRVYYQGDCIAKTQPPAVPPPVIRVRNSNGRYTEECQWTAPKQPPQPKPDRPPAAEKPKSITPNKPAPDHPWRKPWVTKSLTSKG
jgi:transposase